MKKPNLKKFFGGVRTGLNKHSPEILMGIGIAGMITATVLAVIATPKALQLIEEEKRKQEKEKLQVKDVVKVAWKPYIPTATTMIFSTACIIGGNSVNAKRNAAIATAYKLSEAAYSEYREKVVETIGEKKEQAVKDKIAKDRVEQNPPVPSEIIITGKGDTLCLDLFSNRPFRSDIDKIKRAQNELNHRLLTNDYISLNEYYSELGMAHDQMGYSLGWRSDKGLIELYFSSQLTPDGEPCLTVGFNNPPEYGYDSAH